MIGSLARELLGCEALVRNALDLFVDSWPENSVCSPQLAFGDASVTSVYLLQDVHDILSRLSDSPPTVRLCNPKGVR